jgi:hypothetical protein
MDISELNVNAFVLRDIFHDAVSIGYGWHSALPANVTIAEN